MTYGDIQSCLIKERAPASVDIRSKYPEEHSVTLVQYENFLRGLWPLLLCVLFNVYSDLVSGAH